MLGIHGTRRPYGHGASTEPHRPWDSALGHQLASTRHSGKPLLQRLMTLDNTVALDPANKLTNLLVPSGIQGSQNCPSLASVLGLVAIRYF